MIQGKSGGGDGAVSGSERNHYQVLGVSYECTKPEVDRAYLALKTSGKLDAAALWELERAYVTLCDVNLKRKYDADLRRQAVRPPAKAAAPESATPPRPGPVPPHRPMRPATRIALLAGSGLVLLVVFMLRVWPMVAWRFQTFDAGTRLVSRSDGVPFGVVLQYESAHIFPSGSRSPAYRLQLSAGDVERWLTKEEVNQLATPAPR